MKEKLTKQQKIDCISGWEIDTIDLLKYIKSKYFIDEITKEDFDFIIDFLYDYIQFDKFSKD